MSSDARWFDVEADMQDAIAHFAKAVALFDLGGFDDASLKGYQASMALMHAMQSGHTSLEASLLRVLAILGETPPIGERWHEDLIRRAATALTGDNARPAILPAEIVAFVEETRRFRHKATRSYNSFDPKRAGSAIEAASRLSLLLTEVVPSFRRRIDPA